MSVGNKQAENTHGKNKRRGMLWREESRKRRADWLLRAWSPCRHSLSSRGRFKSRCSRRGIDRLSARVMRETGEVCSGYGHGRVGNVDAKGWGF